VVARYENYIEKDDEMSTQVIRIQGFSKGSLTNIGNECDRKAGVEHRNNDIDPTRTHLNKSYKDCSDSFYTEFHQILSATQCEYKEKKTGKAFEGMIITADREFFDRMGYKKQFVRDFPWSEDKEVIPKEVNDFFNKAYKWALEQIGYKGTDKNILSAKVHYDETTPHMHIYYLPMTNKWNTKVYEKDKHGKILRSDKGTPIQSKDEKGKTLFETVESPTPKLSKTEFWRFKGGKNSYRILQDDFHEKIGKEYNLERGEIGSTRKHTTKHQWEEQRLIEKTKNAQQNYQETKQNIENELRPFQDMKTKTEKIEEKKTKIPLIGKTMVNTREWERTVRQAQAYCVNRDEIKRNRQDRKEIDEKLAEIAKKEDLVNQNLYHARELSARQRSVNAILESTERELKEENEKLARLDAKYQQLEASCFQRDNIIEKLEQSNREVYTSLTSVVKATGMLKYSKGEYRVEGLTEAQERLIDSISNHGSYWARRDGYSDLADDMSKNVGLSGGMKAEIEKLTPKRTHTYSGPSL